MEFRRSKPDDAPMIRDMLMETTEAVTMIVHKGPLPLGGFYDIEETNDNNNENQE